MRMSIEKWKKGAAEAKSQINKEVSQECSCNEIFISKKLITACVLSALLSGAAVFTAVRLGGLSTTQEIQNLIKSCNNLDERLKNINKTVLILSDSVGSIKSEIKADQENLAYIYSKIASLQKDVTVIKDSLYIDTTPTPEAEMQNMTADQISFIETFENLVNEGAPFEEFLKSFESKFDVSTYASGKDLLLFKSTQVLSVADLQKLFSNVAKSEFGMNLNETFWEKQKRIIKETFVNALTIKKDEETKQEENKEELKEDDKTLFAKACESMNSGKLEETIELLAKIDEGHDDVTKFISQAKQRVGLAKAFEAFKKEFISVASNSTEPSQEEK